jgi:hypothetical protein
MNQQNLYSSKDAVVASWIHKSGVTGTGTWNFGTWQKEDTVTVYGEMGTIIFSVFKEAPVQLFNARGKVSLHLGHPENIQLYHVQNMKYHLDGIKEHPSTGVTGLHTSWVMDQILGRIV